MAAVAVAGIAAGLVATSGGGSSPPTVRVALFGDSLAYQAAPYFSFLVQAGGKAVVVDDTFGGTAVCDWLTRMERVAQADRPAAVVLEFSGDTSTSCMQGCVPESAATVTKYCSDMDRAIAVFRGVHARVFLAGTPIDYAQQLSGDPHWDDLNRAFALLAAASGPGVSYVDAGAAVEAPGRRFAWTLPCLSFEPCTGPVVDGVRSDVVRAPDGVHFCASTTTGPGQVGGCSGYSSGAFRFAAAMAGPVIAALHLGRG